MKSLEKFPDAFLAEIAGQPEAMRRAADGLAEQRAALEIVARDGAAGPVVFTGMGASHAACQVPVTALTDAAVDARRADAAELLHFGLPALASAATVVLVSQSGRSAETLALARAIADAGGPSTLAVTNGEINPLATAAGAALDVRAGQEEGPSTMTFAASIVVLGAVAEVLSGAEAGTATDRVATLAAEAAGAAGDLIDDLIHGEDWFDPWLGDRRRVVVLGRGAGLAAAEAGALLMKEAARVQAEAAGSGQFRHGPLELAGPDLAVALVSTEPATRDLDLRLASDLAEAGAATLLIGPDVPASIGASAVDTRVWSRAIAPAVAAIPLQLLAWRLAARRGLPPGRLAVASKVTTHE